MKTTFTIDEIKTYIASKDSLGDVAYYLTAENIIKANTPKICKNCDWFNSGICGVDNELTGANDYCNSFVNE